MKALVNKIIPFSSVDGPGNRTAIFLQGCNFNCQYCHNPETIHTCVHCGTCVDVCPAGALQMIGGRVEYDPARCVQCDACLKHCPHGASPRVQWMTAAQVMAEVEKNMPFIRGISVSGGECSLQRDFLVELLGLAREKGLGTLLDSNGSYDFMADPQLMAVTDGVMLDVKAWDEAEHRRVTGVSNAMVLHNLTALAAAGKLEEVRTVVSPGLFDARQTVEHVCRALAPHLQKRNVRYKIICYRPMGVRLQYQHLQPPTADQLQQLETVAHANGVTDTVII